MTGNGNLKISEPRTLDESAVSAPPDTGEAALAADEACGCEAAARPPDDGPAGEYVSGTESLTPDEEDEAADPAESVGQARAVPVRMFDHEYHIMSDKPRLAEILAAAVDREAGRIKAANGAFNRGVFDWPVQAAFKLAHDLYYAQRALGDCRRELAQCRCDLETLTLRVERDAEKLAGLIDAGLDDQEL